MDIFYIEFIYFLNDFLFFKEVNINYCLYIKHNKKRMNIFNNWNIIINRIFIVIYYFSRM